MDVKIFIDETTKYDKKYEAKRPKNWLKNVSAFVNGTGGTLILVFQMMIPL